MRHDSDLGWPARGSTAPFPSRILIVDDDGFVRRVAAAVLEQSGAAVTAVASGAEALNAVAQSSPDLILLDMMMPHMDGRATLVALKQSGAALPPVIFLTARDEPADAAQLRDMGAAGIILKPFDPLTFADAIRRLLARPASPESEQRKAEQISAIGMEFRSKLPITIAGLICDLDVLRTSGWDAQVAEGLLTKAHTLAGSAGLFKLHAVGEAAAHVETAVLTLMKSEGEPADLIRISAALAALSEAAAVVAAAPLRENGAG